MPAIDRSIRQLMHSQINRTADLKLNSVVLKALLASPSPGNFLSGRSLIYRNLFVTHP